MSSHSTGRCWRGHRKSKAKPHSLSINISLVWHQSPRLLCSPLNFAFSSVRVTVGDPNPVERTWGNTLGGSVPLNCPPSSSQHNWSAATTGDTSNEPLQLLLSPHISRWLDHICLYSKKERQWDEPIIQRWYSGQSTLPALSALTMASCHLLKGWWVEDSWWGPWNSACDLWRRTERHQPGQWSCAQQDCVLYLATVTECGGHTMPAWCRQAPRFDGGRLRWHRWSPCGVCAFWIVQERCRLQWHWCENGRCAQKKRHAGAKYRLYYCWATCPTVPNQRETTLELG